MELKNDTPLRVLELGSGCGIVSLMLALQRPAWQLTGVEIQPGLHELALANAALCGVDIDFRLSDLREFTSSQPFGLIVGNPPWQPAGSGKLSPEPGKNLSRFELACSLAGVLACLRRNLLPGGDALLLYPLARADDLRRQAKQTFLDIIALLPATGLKQHMICHIRHEGTPL